MLNQGATLNLQDSAEYGGGICNHAALNVQNGSTIGGVGASNMASNGGGLHNYAGTTTVKASTVISNTASDDGGGIYVQDGTSAGPPSDYVRLNTRLFLPNIQR
jgi:predicted outer membrane repeat protein